MNNKIIELVKREKGKVNAEHQQAIDTWKSWYNGYDKNFHNETYRVDKTLKHRNKYTLNLAKKSCEDLTKLVWSEHTQIIIDDEDTNKFINNILSTKVNNFYFNMSMFIEKVLANGSGVLIEYIDNGEPIIDYVEANNILPYSYTNKYINGFCTVTERKQGDSQLLYLTYHDYKNHIYTKTIKVYEYDGKKGEYTERDIAVTNPEIESYEERETSYPPYQFLSTSLVNNINSSPLGISIYANSIDKLKAIDTKFDSLTREFVLGKKRIMVDSSLTKAQAVVDPNTQEVNHVSYFDTNDEAFLTINGYEDKAGIKEINMNLRVSEHIQALNSDISWYGSHIGLGINFYSFQTQGLKTATEIISEKSEAYRTKQTIQNNLIIVISDLINAILELCDLPKKNIRINFDDSIIQDLESEKNNARLEVAQGLMSKMFYLKKYRNLTEEEAREELEKIQSESSAEEEEIFNQLGD